MLITIENADKKLLDVIKSVIKLSPNANIKIKKDTLLESGIDFSEFDIKSFKDIENPLKWQTEIRNEWEER